MMGGLHFVYFVSKGTLFLGVECCDDLLVLTDRCLSILFLASFLRVILPPLSIFDLSIKKGESSKAGIVEVVV
jgi:hypothetical protein